MDKDNSSVLAQLAEIKTDLRHIMRKVDCLSSDHDTLIQVDARSKANCDDIQSLERKSDGWNFINSLAVFIASLFAYLSGGK